MIHSSNFIRCPSTYGVFRSVTKLWHGAGTERQVCVLGTQSSVNMQCEQYLWIGVHALHCGCEAG